MTDLKQLLAQKAALDKQIEDLKREQREQAIAQVRELMEQFGLTMADVLPRRATRPAPARQSPGRKAAVKYRNAETGDTWSGRGLQPRWLRAALDAGRKLEDFQV
jgi:DNA-binding protein H-NS